MAVTPYEIERPKGEKEMKIKVLGPGCARCRTTEKNVIDACDQLEMAADISHITDAMEIASHGVLMTPAVIVDDQVISSGTVPSVEELKKTFAKLA